jgi:hypothetical protein
MVIADILKVAGKPDQAQNAKISGKEHTEGKEVSERL